MLLCRGEIGDDRHADAAAAGPRRIDDADHLDLALAGAQDGDFRQIAGAAERHPGPAARGAFLEQLGAIRTGAAKEIERDGEIFGSEPALLGKTLRRQVIGIAIERHLPDLDETLADTAAQIAVGEPERDAEIAGELALGDRAVTLDRGQKTQHDLRIASFLARLRHDSEPPDSRGQGLPRSRDERQALGRRPALPHRA